MRLVDAEGRTCTRCETYKPWDSFPVMRSSSTGHRPDCKPCHTKLSIEHRSARRAVDPEAWDLRRSEITLLHRQGITVEQYREALVAQGGGCAICGADNARTKRKSFRPLLVDHDHKTGVFRGLLCDPCNNGLGRFDDDPQRLLQAAAYLGGV